MWKGVNYMFALISLNVTINEKKNHIIRNITLEYDNKNNNSHPFVTCFQSSSQRIKKTLNKYHATISNK